MYLQGVRQLTPLHAALVLVPGYLVGAFIGPLAGRLADRLGAVYPATVGLAIQCVALVIYANLGLTTPLWVVIVAAIINGIGSGAFFPANNAAVMKAAPGRSFGVASGVLRTFANVGMVFSFSVAILIAARSDHPRPGLRHLRRAARVWDRNLPRPSRPACTPPSTPRWRSWSAPRCCRRCASGTP